MKPGKLKSFFAAVIMATIGITAQAAVSCNFFTRDIGELYDASATNGNGSRGELRVSCTRTSLLDPGTIYYSLAADYGLNSTGGVTRNIKNGANALLWILRVTSLGNTTNWGPTSAAGLLTGSVSFGASSLFLNTNILNATGMRVRGTAGGNPAAPAAGTYVDTVTITPSISSDSITGPFNLPSPPTTQINISVGVGAVCVVRQQGRDLFFDYTAFGAAQSQTSTLEAVCSSGLPYKVTVLPTVGAIAGVAYTVTRTTGLNRTGNGNGQNSIFQVDLAANQAGTCGMATCAGSNVHTVTLEY